VLLLLLTVGAFAFVVAGGAAASDGPTWWKVDTHQHSSFSGDARADIGLDAANDKSLNYNAVFVTDHDRMGSFSVRGANGNSIAYREGLTGPPATRKGRRPHPEPAPTSGRWVQETIGAAASYANAVVTSPVHSGAGSLHLAVTSSSGANGRTLVHAKRGPGLRSGAVTLDFWVYPARIDASAGVDVSVSLGGDLTSGVRRVFGYTTADGVAHPGKSTVLVWQLGVARAAANDGTTNVITNQLPYTLGAWNHYVIDVTTGTTSWTPDGGATTSLATTGVNALSADRPADYVVLAYPKMEASATNGTADAYFDDYVAKAAAPRCPAADFVYRNSLIDSGRFNGQNAAGQSFVLFPAREMGQNNHTQQFNFDITSRSRFSDVNQDSASNDAQLCAATNKRSARWRFSYLGSDNTTSVQASGYPAQDNHPGITDTTADVIRTRAHGADLVEVQTARDFSKTWDAILRQHHQVIGTYGSDAHEGVRTGAPADFIDAPNLTLRSLMRSLFEGRLYMASNDFAGRILFNLDPASPSPYPARYPVYVPASRRSAKVHLAITGGLASGERIVWVYGGAAGVRTTSDAASSPSYAATRSIRLPGRFTYVRAEVRDAAGALVANTQPIFFEDLPHLPAGMSYHVDSVTARAGCGCTVAMTKGITASHWRSSRTLALTLVDPAHSTARLLLTSSRRPRAVTIDGSRVRRSSSLSAYAAAKRRRAWHYDASAHLLYLQDIHAHARSRVSIAFSAAAQRRR
jgi:hypothetical protein